MSKLAKGDSVRISDDAPCEYRGRSPKYFDAVELVSIGLDVHGRDALMIPSAAFAWSSMVKRASCDGVKLLVVSAFRSTQRQWEIVMRKRAKGLSWEEILAVNAYPGFSEHHSGCAVDICSTNCFDLVDSFDETTEFQWLTQNASSFCFFMSYPKSNTTGIVYEPWHWMWAGEM